MVAAVVACCFKQPVIVLSSIVILHGVWGSGVTLHVGPIFDSCSAASESASQSSERRKKTDF